MIVMLSAVRRQYLILRSDNLGFCAPRFQNTRSLNEGNTCLPVSRSSTRHHTYYMKEKNVAEFNNQMYGCEYNCVTLLQSSPSQFLGIIIKQVPETIHTLLLALVE